MAEETVDRDNKCEPDESANCFNTEADIPAGGENGGTAAPEGADDAENAENVAEQTGVEKDGRREKDRREKEKDRDKKDKKKSASDLARAEARNAELEKSLSDEKDRYARLAAEYDNYRKRTARELDGRYADAKADVWKTLLAVVDNFERALAAGKSDQPDPFREGIELTYRQLKEQMEKAGVKEIEAMGKEFDPELHNAVMHCDDGELGENIIADVFMKGYVLDDKVLRHSMVKVAN